jgi:hypothetical protein
MAIVRLVTFDGVTTDRMNQMRDEMQGREQPEGLNAKEIIVLHDPDTERSTVLVFFDNEDDYRQGDEILSNMDRGDTPGNRTSVTRYDVAHRDSM